MKELPVESVRERDIDLLILEEWNVDLAFCTWFVRAAKLPQFRFDKSRGAHSVTHGSAGETDLFLEAQEGRKLILLLVENKIGAIAQDRQGTRYRQRAEDISRTGQYHIVRTCIVAPERYLDLSSDVREYQHTLAYEQMRKYFLRLADGRSKYKAMMIQCAIDQERRGYHAKGDLVVTRFWKAYWQHLRDRFPGLYMKEPTSVPEKSDWPLLGLDWLPNKWRIKHKLAQGHLDMETDLTPGEAKSISAKLADRGMKVAQTGKTICLRLDAPLIDRKRDFYEQIENVRLALERVQTYEMARDLFLALRTNRWPAP